MTEPWITEEGHYPELTDEQYHRDPVVGGSLSSSGARSLLACPAKFAYEREHSRPDTKAFDLGHAAHREVLGVGAGICVLEGTGSDPNAWRTNADKAAVEVARKSGLTPITPRDYERVEAMAAALRAHPIAGPLFARPGKAEQSYIARCPDTDVWCRVRADWMPEVSGGRVLVVDYKSSNDAEPGAFEGSMSKYGYHVQGAWYCDVLRWLGHHEPTFVLVAQEKTPPYLVTVGVPDQHALQLGRDLARAARELFRACTELDYWPGYPTEVVELSLPPWADRDADALLAHHRDVSRLLQPADTSWMIGDPA